MDKTPVATNPVDTEQPEEIQLGVMQKVVDPIQSPAEEKGESKEMTNEEIIEEIKRLKAVVEAGSKSEEELRGQVGNLTDSLQAIKDKYPREWSDRKRQWKQMQEELQQLSQEQSQLEGKLEPLKKTLGIGLGTVRGNLMEIRKLTWKVNELKYGKVKKTVAVKKDGTLTDTSVDERKAAVAMLPEEIWELIFGKLANPKKELWISQWKSAWLLEQALPYLYQYLPGDKLLKCRLMSKGWKIAVDQFLDDHPSVRPHNSDTHDPRRMDFVNPMMEKQIGESYFLNFNMSTDMSILDDPGFIGKWIKNRIIGRSITLRLGIPPGHVSDEDITRIRKNEEDGFHQWWDKFYSFLNLFGEEIWSLNIIYFFNPRSPDTWQHNIPPFLAVNQFHIFPNLRKLRLNGGYLHRLITPESISEAPKLESLECDSWEHGGTIITAMIGKHHTQLRRLHLKVGIWFNVNRLAWPNLRELRLNGLHENIFAGVWLGVRRMPHLTKLELEVSTANASQGTFRSLLRIVGEYSVIAPLNTVRLGGPLHKFHYPTCGNIEGSCYALPNLKTLEFELMLERDSEPTYDFLLYMFPLLENLNVFIRNRPGHQSDEGEELVQEHNILENQLDLLPLAEFNGGKKPARVGKEEEILEVNKYMFTGEMYKSNIWELMPLLKVFTFQWEVFTRDGYEAYKEKLSN